MSCTKEFKIKMIHQIPSMIGNKISMLMNRKNELIQSKFKMIFVLGAFLTLSSVFGVFFSLKMGKRLPKSIIYDIKDNKIIVKYYFYTIIIVNSPYSVSINP